MTPKQTLEKIEKQFNWLRWEMWRKMEIWEYIAMQINSTEGNENEYWCQVMDQYRDKYQKKQNNGNTQ
jgi:hypothetical protein